MRACGCYAAFRNCMVHSCCELRSHDLSALQSAVPRINSVPPPDTALPQHFVRNRLRCAALTSAIRGRKCSLPFGHSSAAMCHNPITQTRHPLCPRSSLDVETDMRPHQMVCAAPPLATLLRP